MLPLTWNSLRKKTVWLFFGCLPSQIQLGVAPAVFTGSAFFGAAGLRPVSFLAVAGPVDDDLLAPRCQDATAAFFVQDAGVGPRGVDVGLVAADDELAGVLEVLRAVLHAGVAPLDAELEP